MAGRVRPALFRAAGDERILCSSKQDDGTGRSRCLNLTGRPLPQQDTRVLCGRERQDPGVPAVRPVHSLVAATYPCYVARDLWQTDARMHWCPGSPLS